MADILIGNVRGPQGEQGDTGATGPQGDAATIAVGSVTTVPYGQNARVTNSGTSGAAVFDFVIPQGRPGEQVTKIDNLTIDAITEPATQFPVPAVGDTGSTLFGKISKWFSDMAALVATKLNAANVVNNLTTTASGYALDARQGKVLNDEIAPIGEIITSYGDTSINANEWATGKSITVPAGTYVILHEAHSTTGIIRCGWSTSTGCWSASSGAYSRTIFTRIAKFTSSTTISNSLFASTAGSYSNAITAVRIK